VVKEKDLRWSGVVKERELHKIGAKEKDLRLYEPNT
jgi:hypothetical protein